MRVACRRGRAVGESRGVRLSDEDGTALAKSRHDRSGLASTAAFVYGRAILRRETCRFDHVLDAEGDMRESARPARRLNCHRRPGVNARIQLR